MSNSITDPIQPLPLRVGIYRNNRLFHHGLSKLNVIQFFFSNAYLSQSDFLTSYSFTKRYFAPFMVTYLWRKAIVPI